MPDAPRARLVRECIEAEQTMDNERDGYVNACKALAVYDALTALRAEVEGMLHAIPPRNDGETPTDWCIRVNDWEEQNVAIQRILAALDARRGA